MGILISATLSYPIRLKRFVVLGMSNATERQFNIKQITWHCFIEDKTAIIAMDVVGSVGNTAREYLSDLSFIGYTCENLINSSRMVSAYFRFRAWSMSMLSRSTGSFGNGYRYFGIFDRFDIFFCSFQHLLCDLATCIVL